MQIPLLKSSLKPTPGKMRFLRVASAQLLVAPLADPSRLSPLNVRQEPKTAADERKRERKGVHYSLEMLSLKSSTSQPMHDQNYAENIT